MHPRRIAVFGTLLAALAGPAAVAQEVGGGGDNVAVAINTKDGSSIFRLAFKIHRTAKDVVDNDNAAAAVASCEACQTVAVAIQVVLVFSDPSVLTTDNLAIAINQSCIECETLASAYQWVLGTDGPVRFTAEGQQALAELRRRLIELKNGELSIFEIQAELEKITDELAIILETQLVPAGNQQPETPAAAATPTTPTSPSPAETAEPSPSPEATDTPIVAPTPPAPTPTESP